MMCDKVLLLGIQHSLGEVQSKRIGPSLFEGKPIIC